ncbi:MAG: hypothetical protein Q4F95_03340 [Oscillospiraceae bacterium]|nr:hypothetical protein [Oscillospiraceae bacterium]
MAQFSNQASLTYNGVTTTSNTITGEITEVLKIFKDAAAQQYQYGDTIYYEINLQNQGTSDYSNLTITDDLGVYTSGTDTFIPLTFVPNSAIFFSDGIIQQPPTTQIADGKLVISGLSVKANKSSHVLYSVTVNSFAPLSTGSIIENTATISGGTLASPISATEIVTVNTQPNLTIFKDVYPKTIVDNGQITYTFTIQNTGDEATAAALISVSDIFTPAIENISVSLDGVTWPATDNYTYSITDGKGVFVTEPGKITVPAADITQNPVTGEWTINPGIRTLTVTGTV